MSPGVAEDLGGQDLADAEDLGERAAGGGDCLGAAAAVVGKGAIDPADVRDLLAGDRLAFEVDRVGGLDGGQQPGGAFGRELARSAARAACRFRRNPIVSA